MSEDSNQPKIMTGDNSTVNINSNNSKITIGISVGISSIIASLIAFGVSILLK